MSQKKKELSDQIIRIKKENGEITNIPIWKTQFDTYGKGIPIHKQKRHLNPFLKSVLSNPKNKVLDLSSGLVWDKEQRKIIKVITSKGNFRPSLKILLDDELNRNNFIISNKDVIVVEGQQNIDYDPNEASNASVQSNLKRNKNRHNYYLEPRKEFINPNTNELKTARKGEGFRETQINRGILRKFNKYQELLEADDGFPLKNSFKGRINAFHKPKRTNQGASVFQIYNYFTDEPDSIETFIEDIQASYEVDFKSSDKTRPNHKVLLLFGDSGAEFRWFPLDNIEDLVFMIDEYNNKEYGTGSDAKQIDGEALVSIKNLDKSFFRISLSGSPIAGAKGNQVAFSRYFFLNQPTTSNNECLEGAIKRFLGLKERVHTMRVNMNLMCEKIKLNDMIKFEDLILYENNYEINIDIYEDKPHIKGGVPLTNRIRKSENIYEKTMKLLYREDHFFLINKNKKCINSITREDCRKLGLERSKSTAYRNIVQLLNRDINRDSRGRKEMAVIFDNETIFDKFDEQFLKVYGVSWFVWDFDEDFNYEEGWNIDRTDNKFHHPPFCYYENGHNCEDKLIQFLLNPPDGIIYRPMGFNNSRFDNFSFCQSAHKFRVLNEVFLCGGSILYCNIEGIKNVWDASRFLIGQSLDGACKSYDTNPKKQKDLINHYEIQCYYERNGMEGVVELLNNNQDYILYNKFDVISLCDLIQKMRNSYKTLFSEDIFDSLTISSFGYGILNNTWNGKEWCKEQIQIKYESALNEARSNKDTKKYEEIKSLIMAEKKTKKKYKIYKAQTYTEDLFYRKALTAGRTQSFYGMIDLIMEMGMPDVKSLYPTIMGSYDNDCPMPYGIAIPRTADEGYMKGHLGVYRCNIKHQRCIWKNQERVFDAFKKVKEETGQNLFKQYAPNVIARREKDKPLDWFFKGEINDVNLTSVDIDVLRWATEDYDCVEVFEGYYFTESSKELFKDFLDPPKQEKTRQDKLKAEGSSEYNNAIREGCKGISNAISGKVIEQIHEDITKSFSLKSWNELEQDVNVYSMDVQDFGCGVSFITGKKNASAVFNDCEESKRKPSYLGVFIYSYSRKLMYQKLLSRYLCLYMDTDSACMPLFEWKRCMAEDYDKTLCNTGEYGCLEEEVCYGDIPANRLIGISPKNYAVLNDRADEIIIEKNKSLPADKQKGLISKRKFKGVRKADMWCPLTKFGDYSIIDGKLVGDAVDYIRGNKSKGIERLSQDVIRRYRETNCCVNCINNKLETGKICDECKKYGSELNKAYSTEMFERLVKGEKIAVFCSMIQRIKYRVGEETTNDLLEQLGNDMSVEEIESIVLGGDDDKKPFQFTITSKNLKIWEEQKLKFKEENPNMCKEELKEKFASFYNRFKKIKNERELKDMFSLKQQFMIKII